MSRKLNGFLNGKMNELTLFRWGNHIVFELNDCWRWRGDTSQGYGRMRINKKPYMAHRLGYEYFIGPIPDGLVLDHLCRNHACCNPRHLEAVTHKVNILRGEGIAAVNSKKTHCARGHLLAPENSYGDFTKSRSCKACATLTTKLRNSKRDICDICQKTYQHSYLTRHKRIMHSNE